MPSEWALKKARAFLGLITSDVFDSDEDMDLALIFDGIRKDTEADAYTRGYNDGRAAAIEEMREAVKR